MSEQITVTLPDGSERAVPVGTTPADVAAAIGPRLAKAAVAAKADGEWIDLTRPLEHDVALDTLRIERPSLEDVYLQLTERAADGEGQS